MQAIQERALVEIASQFSRGNQAIIAKVQGFIKNPPTTSEEIGYYIAASSLPEENCFRALVNQLQNSGYTSSAEDKYVYPELFMQWTGTAGEVSAANKRLAALPKLVQELFVDFDQDVELSEASEIANRVKARFESDYAAAMNALELAFVEIGEPLLCFDTGESDTIVFINVEPSVAARWRDVRVCTTCDGESLGIRAPSWDKLWWHLGYALQIDLGEPPVNLGRPAVLQDLETAFVS